MDGGEDVLEAAIVDDNPDAVVNETPGMVKIDCPGRLVVKRETVEVSEVTVRGSMWPSRVLGSSTSSMRPAAGLMSRTTMRDAASSITSGCASR